MEKINLILEQIDWINVLAGFFIALSPVFFRYLVKVIKLYITNPALNGHFFFYHSSVLDVKSIREKEIIFTKSIRGIIKVKMPRDSTTGLSYSGRILKSSGALAYIQLTENSKKIEKIYLVLNIPLQSDFKITSGVFSTINVKHIPVCGEFILNRDKLHPNKARRYFSNNSTLIANKVL
ncbi:hypothetical protein CLV90_3205 [Maribacter spongiicola]|uniref:Uncharacterized protein n=1 Tax=Maribacter spongiicola TaxID=1206753 RepID=A0A4R7JUF7_9FLAO|nr:hypothetical protein [Maribacter spongiicola]TDT41971.1 hypothetical protein CLV90_3205 [Maribacter spongiicola]